MMNALICFEFAVSFVIWAWIGWAWWQRRQAGALLVGFEPNQGPSLRPTLLLVMLVFAVAVLAVGAIMPNISMGNMSRSLFGSSVGALMAGQMFLAPQIRQHGVLVNSQLVRWNMITSYTWERNKLHEWTLCIHTSLPFVSTRRMAMPPIYRDKVEEVFAQHTS